jgi:saxitoxin biosynthesis operon SxtJ-like protein
MMHLFNWKITKDQSRDTGMGVVLLLLLLFLARKREWYLIGAIAVHVLNMIVPQLYRPIAVVWFGLSDLLGTIVSKILLVIVFFGVVTPIAVLRRLFGKDSLKLRAFKTGQDSVMLERNHVFVRTDLERPY